MSQQRRIELIDSIVAQSPGTEQLKDGLRRELFGMSMEDLQKIADRYAKVRAEAARQVAAQPNPQVIEAERQAREAAEKLLWSQIFRTPINGRVAVDNQANRKIISSWVSLDEQISPAWFKQVLAENSGLAQSLMWRGADALDPV